MNPYKPPRGEIKPNRWSSPIGRTAAERAFDWAFLPLIPILVALAFFINAHPVAKAVAILGVTAHWGFCVTKLLRAWRDPAGKVLRFVTAAILLFEAFAIISAILQ